MYSENIRHYKNVFISKEVGGKMKEIILVVVLVIFFYLGYLLMKKMDKRRQEKVEKDIDAR